MEDEAICSECGELAEWRDCEGCKGDGNYIENHPDDQTRRPVFEVPRVVVCDSCNGDGGEWFCAFCEEDNAE